MLLKFDESQRILTDGIFDPTFYNMNIYIIKPNEDKLIQEQEST